MHLSLKKKLIYFVLITTSLTLIIGLSFMLINDIREKKKNKANTQKLTAELISEYLVSPLVFKRKEGVKEILSSLRNTPSISYAGVYLKDTVFASYGDPENASLADKKLISEAPASLYKKGMLITTKPVMYQQEQYGTLLLLASTTIMNREIERLWRTALMLLVLLVAFSFVMAYYFQSLLSRPVLKLVHLMQRVTDNKDFSVRAPERKNDEIGALYDGFNKMIEQLAKRDNERELFARRLKMAKEQAENADELKSAFLANMSHEIRTPMNAIIGFSNLLQEGDIDEEDKQESILQINKNGQTLIQLIDDIIDVSKIEAGQIKIKQKNFYLPDLFEELAASNRELIRNTNKTAVQIFYELNIPEQYQHMYADPVRLKQVLTNLLSNAIKFTDKGHVKFSVHNQEKTLLFAVEDTGIGMNAETKRMVFDRFSKAARNDNRLYGGAGLGLAISKSLVEMLGGRIWVKSKLHEGSVFYFTIPWVKPVSDNNTNITEKQSAGEQTFYWKDKILIIAEDEDANYKYLETLLKKSGVRLLRAVNGYEVLELVQKTKRIDLILMDVKMPGLDGMETARRVKYFNPHIPVVAQTAYTAVVNQNNAIPEFDDMLFKPLDAQTLLRKINRFLA